MQLKAEHNANAGQLEELYTEVVGLVGKQLQRSMAIRAALNSFDYKLQLAVSELDDELKAIDDNCK
jgi:hypothetical protein